MGYRHQWLDGSTIDLPVGKVVCVGRNYAEHAKELNNPIPAQPLLFMKPATSLMLMKSSIQLGQEPIHYETEIALLVSEQLTKVSENEVEKGIGGIGVAFDLTLRGLQSRLKDKGLPWEIAKGFDGACPVSGFVPYTQEIQLDDIAVRLTIDEEIQQDGNSSQMLTGILPLLSYISQHFTLQPGDIVLTGTPKGVGQLKPGMRLLAELPGLISATTIVK